MNRRPWLTPLPASPARGEVLIEDVGRSVLKQLDRNTSPLAGEAGRGEPRAPVHPARINWIAVSFLNR